MPRAESKLKVLHLRATNFYGGPERQLHRHALAARQTEFDVIIGSFAENGRATALLDAVAADGIPTRLFAVTGAYDRRAVGLIRQNLREERIAVLCTHDYRSNILARFAVLGTPTRWVAFSRGRTRETLKVRTFNALERFFFRFADRVVAVSGGEQVSLRRWLLPADKVTVVHNAIDISAFSGVKPVALRERFDLPADAVVAVAAGRFSPEKGQLHLLQAAAEAGRRDERIHVVMFGDGPQLELVRNEITLRKLSQRVLCPGFEREMAGCILGADMVVNPSLSEGLPNVVLEAMGLGVPVVATAVGGVPELVRDGETGILVAPADTVGLADGLVRLAADRELRNRLAQKALCLVRESFSFKKQAEELAAVYRGVLHIG